MLAATLLSLCPWPSTPEVMIAKHLILRNQLDNEQVTVVHPLPCYRTVGSKETEASRSSNVNLFSRLEKLGRRAGEWDPVIVVLSPRVSFLSASLSELGAPYHLESPDRIDSLPAL